jgi:ankyrin repeat protein
MALESARLLIERGANVNARVWAGFNDGERESGEWRTPLGMARRNHHHDVVAFLLAAGAKQQGYLQIS